MLLEEIFQKSRAGLIDIDPFFYTAYFPIGSFTAGVTLPINVSINADSDFVITNSMLAAYAAGPAFVVNPDYTLTILDSGSGRNLMDKAVPVFNIMGTAQLPYVWPEAKRIDASSTLTFTMTNNEAAAANVWITLGGFKVFKVKTYER